MSPPRPRSKSPIGLPPNLYPAGANAWRYKRPDDGTWHGMGTDKARAIAAAKQLNSLLMTGSDLVGSVLGSGMTVREFIETIYEPIVAERALAKNSRGNYKVRLGQIKSGIGDKICDQVTLKDCSELLDSFTPRSSNQLRTRLIDVMRYIVAKGMAPQNLAELTIEKTEKKERKRHTVAGLAAIRAASPPWLQNAIDLSLITTQARNEIIQMKFTDVRDGRLHVVRAKTQRATDAAYNSMKITPQLAAAIQRCRDDVASPFLIHRRPDRLDAKQRKQKEHWTQVTGKYLSDEFKAARDSANPYPNYTTEQQPGFHEIRALALHLYKKAKKAPEERQKLASHANQQQTAEYEAGHEDIVWTESDPDLDISQFTGGM